MLLLIAIPVFLAVAAFQRYLAIYAPTNILIRHVHSSPARLRTAAKLAALATVLLVAMRCVQLFIHVGGPGWLNLIVLVLAWDAIKIGALAAFISFRRGGSLPGCCPARRKRRRDECDRVTVSVGGFN